MSKTSLCSLGIFLHFINCLQCTGNTLVIKNGKGFTAWWLVNNVVLSMWKLLRVDLKCSYHTHTPMFIMWGNECVNYLNIGDHYTVYMNIKSSYTL